MLKIGEIEFKSQALAKTFLRELIQRYEPNQIIDNPNDHKFLLSLIERHSEREEKIGPGIKAFISVRDYMKALGLKILRTDGSQIDFSWVHCITGSKKSHIVMAMRVSIEYQVIDFKDSITDFVCGICNKPIELTDKLNIDHEVPFKKLAEDFLSGKNHPIKFDDCEKTNRAKFQAVDSEFEKAWASYHKTNAILRPTHAKCNLARNKAVTE